MKKALIISLTLSLILSLIFAGCSEKAGGNKPEEGLNEQKKPESQASQPSKPSKSSQTENSKDLKVSLAKIPVLADSPDKGYYVELMKAIDEVYTEGNIKIEVNPIKRAQQDLIDGKVDFYSPKIITKNTDISKLPYKILSKRIGVSAFIIYSKIDKKISKKDLDEALEKGKSFPYKLESTPGLKESFKYPYEVSNSVEESLKKVDSGRIDGFIWAQEEADAFIKSNKMKNIYRDMFFEFDDVLAIAKGSKSENVEKILNESISKLEKSGKLKEIYSKIHLPYDSWQPSQMKW